MVREVNEENYLSVGAYHDLAILSEFTEIYSILSVDFHKMPLNNHHFFFSLPLTLSRVRCATEKENFNGPQLLSN
jgi:hypothetical protein